MATAAAIKKDFLWLALAAAFFTLLNTRDLTLHLATSDDFGAIINKGADPHLYRNDFEAHRKAEKISLMFTVPAAMNKVLKLSPTAYAFGIIGLTLCGMVFALFALSWLLFHDRAAAWVGMLLFMAGNIRSAVLAQGVIWTFPLVSVFVVPLLLLTLYLFLSNRLYAATTALAAAFYAHVGFTIFAGFMMCCAAVMPPRSLRWKQLLAAAFLFAVLAAPQAIHVLNGMAPAGSIPPELYLRFLRLRSAHHHFPFSWGPAAFVPLAVLATLYFFVFFQWLRGESPHRKVFGMVLAIFILAAAGTLFSEIIPVLFIIKLALLKSTIFMTLIAALYLGYYVCRKVSGGRPEEVVLAVLLVLCVFVFNPGASPLLVGVLILLDVTRAAPPHKKWIPIAGWAGFALYATASAVLFLKKKTTLSLLLFGQYPALSSYVHELCVHLWIVAVAFAWYLLTCGRRKFRPGADAGGRAAIVLFLIVFAGALAVKTFSERMPERDRKEATAWKEAQLWVEKNTPKDAAFIIPPSRWGWRTYSRRGSAGSWTDFDSWQYNSDPGLFQGSVERLKDLGYDIREISLDPAFDHAAFLERNFLRLKAKDFRRMGNKYHAAYLVTYATRTLDLPSVHANRSFRIYRLKQTNGSQEDYPTDFSPGSSK